MIKVIRSKQGEKNFKKLEKVLKDFSSYYLEVGWFDPKNANKAYIMEFGGISNGKGGLKGKVIPPRPTVIPAVKETNRNVVKRLKSFLDFESQRGGDPIEAYKTIAEDYIIDIRKKIMQKRSPKLSDKSTIPLRRSRGNFSVKPLIDTGEMYDALTYKIKRKGQFKTKYMSGVEVK